MDPRCRDLLDSEYLTLSNGFITVNTGPLIIDPGTLATDEQEIDFCLLCSSVDGDAAVLPV